MGKLILAPPRGDTPSELWIKSFGGTLFGLMWGLLNAGIIDSLLIPHALAIPCAITTGGCIAGAFQGISLRIYTRPAPLWIAASILGWWLAYGGLWFMAHTTMRSPAAITLSLVIGILSSIPQRWMLRRHIDRAWSWVFINMLCWCFIGLMFEHTIVDFFNQL